MRIVIDLPNYENVHMARWWMKLFGSAPEHQEMFQDKEGADVREVFKFWILNDQGQRLFSNQEHSPEGLL